MALKTQNCLRFLGDDMVRNIIEYDDTYKQIYKKDVVHSIWVAAWKNWRKNSYECKDSYIAEMIDWLFDLWGITWKHEEPIKFFQKRFLPSDVFVLKQTIKPGEIYRVSVYFIKYCNETSQYNHALEYSNFVIRSTNGYNTDDYYQDIVSQYTDNIHEYIVLFDDTNSVVDLFHDDVFY